MKRFSENMQQIYWRTPMPKFDFNEVPLQLYWNYTLACVLSLSLLHIFRAASSKLRTQDPRTRDPGPGSLDQRALGHRTQDPRPGTHDPRTDTQDTGPRTREPRTKDLGPRTPKFGTLGLWTFLLSFKIKHWKVRNRLQVNVMMQSTLSHIFTSTYFSRVKVCFWNFQEDSGYCWFLFKWFF